MTASIGHFLNSAIEKINQNDFEMAAADVSIAVAGTAKRAFPGKMSDGQKYKALLKRHMVLISFITIRIRCASIRLRFEHPDVRSDKDGCCTLEDILYHVVRCGLIHEAVFPESIRFGNSISGDGGLPITLLHGLILAVIVAPENKNESLPQDYSQEIRGKTVRLNDYWGKEQELVRFLGLQ